jgi:hypothetical protein
MDSAQPLWLWAQRAKMRRPPWTCEASLFDS